MIVYAILAYALAVCLLALIGALIGKHFQKRKYYKELFALLDGLEQKYYLSEVMEPAAFPEGKLLARVLSIAGKSMSDAIAAERAANREYRSYVELWVHEIKTPISAVKLICENNGYRNISDEADKIEKYVEQALIYARAGSVEKDYTIKQISLKKLVGELLKKNAAYLIAKGIKVNLDVDAEVYADPKWLLFILQQIMDNSVKYGAKTITFAFADHTLTVRDDGIGISSRDLPRVFERGFTGENGRGGAQSTGMGLYLCKALCEKLGLGISAFSEKGTSLCLTFPQNPYVTLL